MIVGTIVSRIVNLLSPLRGGQIRNFSTENSNSTEQSTKWDKLEGNLTSSFVLIDVLKNLKPLSKDILFPENIEGNIFGQSIPLIYSSEEIQRLSGRFAQEWFHIPTEEKSGLFQAFINEFTKMWLFLVGPKGFIDIFVLVVLN